MQRTVEDMARELLSLAVNDGLVALPRNYVPPHPRHRSSGELARVAGLLSEFLKDKPQKGPAGRAQGEPGHARKKAVSSAE